MTDRQRSEASEKPPPDGEPKPPLKDKNSTGRSKVSEVQDPLISGDAGKAGGRVDTDEANVDEAGQLRRKKGDVDLLH